MADPRNSDGSGAVVVGFDGSEQARLAAFWAAREAASGGCALLVVEVLRVPMPDLALTSMTVPLPEAMTEEAVRGYAERELASVAADCRALCAGLEVRTRLEQGHPADALSAVGRDADLLVVGSHGRGAVRRALLGSVSHAVLYHAPCSVAIVHRDTTTPRGGDA